MGAQQLEKNLMQEVKNEVDFKQIDERTRFKNRSVREMEAHRDGFDTITEHIVMTYRETQSLRKTGKVCGNISTIAVRSVLSKCDESLRNPGGRVWSKLSDDDVLYIRSYKHTNNRIFKMLATEVGETISKRAGKKMNISVETIRDVWKKKTHKNVKQEKEK